MTVLVVDDSASVRNRLIELLRERNPDVRVREADGCDSALSELERGGIEAAVLEIHLSDRRGLELLSCLRRSVDIGLIVVLTGTPSEHHRRECELRGADHYLDKSRSFEHAVDAVVAYTTRRSSALG